MTAQTQENRYEVRLVSHLYDDSSQEWYIHAGCRRTFGSFQEADAVARSESETNKEIIGAVVLEDGIVVAEHGLGDHELPTGVVAGWVIAEKKDRPRHISPGQWDPDLQEFRVQTPDEWERVERQTRKMRRQLYVQVRTFGKVELMGGKAGERHKWTPDFFPLGMKLVQKHCDFCGKPFWFPYGKFAGHEGCEACEKCYCQIYRK